MNYDLFGFDINVWLDAFLRLQIIVILMTVVVMGLIYIERKVLARFTYRLGPMKTGPFGILQSVADALKLVGKEDVRPRNADPWIFELAPFFVFIPVFLGFVVIPFAVGWEVRALELGLLYLLATSSLNVIGMVMAGWGSDNRYALLGGLRSAAQAISYEIPLVVTLLAAAMLAYSLNLTTIAAAQNIVPFIVWQPLGFVIFFIAMLAELNRTPFDIAVGESETAGGPHIEYSGIRWSMFFLAEYAALFIMALVGAAIFLGGPVWPLDADAHWLLQLGTMAVKTSVLIFLVFWTRASWPRMRIDQLMAFSWKVLMPLAFVQVLFNGLVLVYDWPEVLLLIQGLAGVAFLAWIIDRAVTAPARPRVAVGAQSEAVS